MNVLTQTPSAPPLRSVPPETPGTSPDFLAAARVLHGRGWPEAAALAALDTFAAQGARGLVRRVTRISPDADRRLRQTFAREAREHRPNRRGDLITLRSAPRWPWRTSTAEPTGGAA